MPQSPILQVSGVTKTFGGVRALNAATNVSLLIALAMKMNWGLKATNAADNAACPGMIILASP